MGARAPRQHILSDVDPVAKTATCAKCGPTKVSVKPSGGRACMVRRREERARNRSGDPATKRSRDRRAWLRFKYGITVEQWDQMLIKQSGRCWICLDPMLDPFVDHDHTSGRVRGLLCPSCNTMLGLARDRVDVLERASQYLGR